jgi:hypothetical protein
MGPSKEFHGLSDITSGYSFVHMLTCFIVLTRSSRSHRRHCRRPDCQYYLQLYLRPHASGVCCPSPRNASSPIPPILLSENRILLPLLPLRMSSSRVCFERMTVEPRPASMLRKSKSYSLLRDTIPSERRTGTQPGVS